MVKSLFLYKIPYVVPLPGVQSSDSFRDQLRNAVSQNDIKKLDRVIKQSVAVGYPDLDSDIQKARETLYTLQGGQGGWQCFSKYLIHFLIISNKAS